MQIGKTSPHVKGMSPVEKMYIQLPTKVTKA